MQYSEKEYLNALYGHTNDFREGEDPAQYNHDLVIEHNRELITTYPWLSHHCEFDDDGYFTVGDDETYEHTWLDSMPDGWRLAFGLDFCYELKQELKKYDYNNRYFIFDIKEKFGELRWYDGGYPGNSEVENIIDKYCKLSKKFCMDCGNLVEWRLDDPNWIYYFCDDCKRKLETDNENIKFIRIDKED